MQTVTFNISSHPIMTFEIDHSTRTAKLIAITDEFVANSILTDSERTYNGIERRLNTLTNKSLTLKDYIETIKKGEFHADAQRNLNVSIES